MAKKLHGSARTTPVTRKEIQESKQTILTLAKRYRINPNTLIK